MQSYDLDEPSSDRFFLTGSNLTRQERIELIELLMTNIEVFAWTSYEIPKIKPSFIKHELNIIPKAYPVK